MVDLLYLLERLDEVVTTATRLPFSSRVLVDDQEYFDIVDQIRLALPEEVKQARRIISERDQILADAAERAEHLLNRAEEQIAHRVDEHAIAQTAQERAHVLLEDARRESEEIRRQADEYACRVLETLQRRLRQLDRGVQEGLAELRPDTAPDVG